MPMTATLDGLVHRERIPDHSPQPAGGVPQLIYFPVWTIPVAIWNAPRAHDANGH